MTKNPKCSPMENRIRETRMAQGLTQEALALRCHSSQPSVSVTERGHQEPYIYRALAIARALGVSVEHLFPVE